MSDAPRLNGYTFKHPPKPINVWWEPQLLKHQLADGSMAVYNKGFILKGKLEWGSNGWIEQDEYSNIAVMFNQLTGTAKFYPRYTTYPSRVFNVQITNDFNFVPHGGDLQTDRQLYQGSIEFQSSVGDITATATEIF